MSDWKADLELRANQAQAVAGSSDQVADAFLLAMAEAECTDSFLLDPRLFRQLQERGLIGRLERVVRARGKR
jgi:hypothetical protein